MFSISYFIDIFKTSPSHKYIVQCKHYKNNTYFCLFQKYASKVPYDMD